MLIPTGEIVEFDGKAPSGNIPRSSIIEVPDTLKKNFKPLHMADEDEDYGDEEPQQDLCGSWLGAIFKIKYILRVYVKHDAWNEFGAGKCISFPIKISKVPEMHISCEPFRVPKGWNPILGAPDTCHVY